MNFLFYSSPNISPMNPIIHAKQTGVWHVFPELPFDHLTFMGSIFNEDGKEVNAFYHDVLYNIIYCGG